MLRETAIFFYSRLGIRLALILLLAVILAFSDLIGISMIVPLILDNESGSNFILDRIGTFQYLEVSRQRVIVIYLFIIVILVKSVVKVLDGFYVTSTRSRFVSNLRLEIIDRVHKVEYLFFTRRNQGEIQNYLTTEVNGVNGTFKAIVSIAQSGIIALVYFIATFYIAPRFAFVTIFLLVLSNFLFRNLYRKSTYQSDQLVKANSELQEHFRMQLLDLKYTKMAQVYPKQRIVTSGKIELVEFSQVKLGRLDSLIRGLREPIAIICVLTAVSLEIVFFNMGLISLTLALAFLYKALGPLQGIQLSYNNFLRFNGSVRAISKFLTELSNHEESTKAKIKSYERIVFDNVSLSVDGNVILENLNLELRSGERVAIVGASGSGKSTFVSLLSGLIRPSSGHILIDSYEIGNHSILSGIVTQEINLYMDSIFNNVTSWDKPINVNIKRCREILDVLGLEGIDIMDIPSNLSGGEAQRIAIARSFYSSAEILIYDEPTSALDKENERIFWELLKSRFEEKTIIVITHDLAKNSIFDRVLKVENRTISDVHIR